MTTTVRALAVLAGVLLFAVALTGLAQGQSCYPIPPGGCPTGGETPRSPDPTVSATVTERPPGPSETATTSETPTTPEPTSTVKGSRTEREPAPDETDPEALPVVEPTDVSPAGEGLLSRTGVNVLAWGLSGIALVGAGSFTVRRLRGRRS